VSSVGLRWNRNGTTTARPGATRPLLGNRLAVGARLDPRASGLTYPAMAGRHLQLRVQLSSPRGDLESAIRADEVHEPKVLFTTSGRSMRSSVLVLVACFAASAVCCARAFSAPAVLGRCRYARATHPLEDQPRDLRCVLATVLASNRLPLRTARLLK
jgi:hypothetical protein